MCDTDMVPKCTRKSSYYCEVIGRVGRCIWLTERGSRGHQEHKVWHDVGLSIGRRPEDGGSYPASVSAREAPEHNYAFIYNGSMKKLISVSAAKDISIVL